MLLDTPLDCTHQEYDAFTQGNSDNSSFGIGELDSL